MKYIWLIFFCGLPLWYSATAYEVFAVRKSLFLFILSLNLLIWPFIKKPQDFYWSFIDLFPLTYFGLRLLSLFASAADLSLSNSVETLLFEACLLLFYVFLRTQSLDRNWYLNLCRGLLLCSAIVGAMQWFGCPLAKTLIEGRMSAQFFHPNILGITTAAVVSWLYAFKRLQTTNLPYLGLGLIIILLSSSKSALVALIICVVFIHKFSRHCLLPIILLPLLYWLVSPKTTLQDFRNNPRHSLRIRLAAFQSTWNGIKHHPTGVGPGNFGYAINPYLSNDFHQYFPHPDKHSLYKAHNFILETVFESGWLFFVFFLLLIPLLISQPPSPNKYALLCLAIASLGSIYLNYPTGQLLFLVFLAQPPTDEEQPCH